MFIPFRRNSCNFLLNYQLIVIDEQYLTISRTKAHFYVVNWCVHVAVTVLVTFWFDIQTFGFQQCSVVCFDKGPLIMIDKCRRDDTRLFV